MAYESFGSDFNKENKFEEKTRDEKSESLSQVQKIINKTHEKPTTASPEAFEEELQEHLAENDFKGFTNSILEKVEKKEELPSNIHQMLENKVRDIFKEGDVDLYKKYVKHFSSEKNWFLGLHRITGKDVLFGFVDKPEIKDQKGEFKKYFNQRLSEDLKYDYKTVTITETALFENVYRRYVTQGLISEDALLKHPAVSKLIEEQINRIRKSEMTHPSRKENKIEEVKMYWRKRGVAV